MYWARECGCLLRFYTAYFNVGLFWYQIQNKVLKFIPQIDRGFQIDGPNDKCDEEILKIFNTWDLPQLKPGGNRCQIKANYLQSRPPLQCGLILELDRNAARL